jgi:hypothetical protein
MVFQDEQVQSDCLGHVVPCHVFERPVDTPPRFLITSRRVGRCARLKPSITACRLPSHEIPSVDWSRRVRRDDEPAVVPSLVT